MSNELSITSLRDELKNNYYPNLKNFLWADSEAKKFLSAVMYVSQDNPALLQCSKESLMSAFMKCAELNLYPSSVSWEAYIIPYNNKQYDWSYKKEAQFQLGYQGVVTLLYRAWITKIYSWIIKENDKFSFINWKINHEIDIFLTSEKRGKAIWAYVTAIYKWEEISLAMNKEDILVFKGFSKSANSKKSSWSSPWNEEKDPELWMWKKTVLKQLSKLLPKTSEVFIALNEDNKDSNINDLKEKVTWWDDELKKAQDALDKLNSNKPKDDTK